MFKKSIIGLAFFCVAVFLPTGAFAQNQILSLNQVVEKVTNHYPQLKAEEYALAASKASQREARYSYVPKVGLDFSATKSDDPVYVFSSLLKQHSFRSEHFAIDTLNEPTPLTNYQTGIEVSFPVFSGFQNEGRLQTIGHNVKASKALKENYEQEAAFAALLVYTRILSLDKAHSFTEKIIEEGEKAVAEAENLKAKGMVLGCDYLTARAVLSQIKKSLETIKYQAEAARGSLNILMGTSVNDSVFLQEGIPFLKSIPANLEGLAPDAFSLKKDLLGIQSQADAALSEFRREKNSWLPKAFAFAREETNTHKWDGNANSFTFGMKFNMDLWEPQLLPRIDRLRSEANKAQSLAQQMKDMTQDVWQQTLNEYKAQGTIVKLIEESAMDATAAVKSINDLYQAGRRTIADLLKAQAYKLEQKITLLNAKYNVYVIYAKLFLLSGQLDKAHQESLEKILYADASKDFDSLFDAQPPKEAVAPTMPNDAGVSNLEETQTPTEQK